MTTNEQTVLTDDQISDLMIIHGEPNEDAGILVNCRPFARAIERAVLAKLGAVAGYEWLDGLTHILVDQCVDNEAAAAILSHARARLLPAASEAGAVPLSPLWTEQIVSEAIKDAKEVFKDSCNHTFDAIEYVGTYLHVAIGKASPPAPVEAGAPALTVWFGKMPESNGNQNWTVVLHRKDSTGLDLFSDGFQIHRSEYYDRARYDADFMRWVIGELDTQPGLCDYDGELKEPAAAPSDAPAQQDIERLAEKAEREFFARDFYQENQPAPAAQGDERAAIPEDCDVRKILLRVVPGDGNGYEVYARNVSDVEKLLSEMGEQLEDFELARGAALARQPSAGDAEQYPYRIFEDGDSWCCIGPNFVDLHRSDAGFGPTPAQALQELRQIESDKARAAARAQRAAAQKGE